MPSGDLSNVTIQPVIDTLTSVVGPMDIVNLFATAVGACILIVLTWFICKWVYRKFVQAVRGRKSLEL